MPRTTKWNKRLTLIGNMYMKLNQPNFNVPETSSDEPVLRAAQTPQSASKKKLTEGMTMYDQFSGESSNIFIHFVLSY